MTDSRKPPQTRDLADLIRQLDSMMEEASRLRAEVTRQLTEQRHQQQSLPSALPRSRGTRGS